MRVLAVNTASARLSIALAAGERILLHADIEEPRDQGNFLLHTVTQGLKERGIAFADLDMMAAVTGPGSFTGIRIGLAAMSGFALASGVRLVGVDSFALYTALPLATPHRLTVMESWRDELYFKLNDEKPLNILPQDCLALLKERDLTQTPHDITVMGDAAQKMHALLPGAVIERAIPDAVQLAQLVQARPHLCMAPEPFYLRDADVSFGRANRTLQQEA